MLDAFYDELVKIGFAKTASALDDFAVRAALAGGAIGATKYIGQKGLALAGAAEDPQYTGQTLTREAAKAGVAGGILGLLIKALAKRR